MQLRMTELRQYPKMKYRDIIALLDLMGKYADSRRYESEGVASVDFVLESKGLRFYQDFIGSGWLEKNGGSGAFEDGDRTVNVL